MKDETKTILQSFFHPSSFMLPKSGTVRVEPVRIKVYGLFWQTRRRYVLQSIFGLGYGVALLVLWFAAWPGMYKQLTRWDVDLPAYMRVTVAVLNELPWILAAAAVIKLFEMWIILRRFTRKEAEQLAKPPASSP
jgi:hypothetical protein